MSSGSKDFSLTANDLIAAALKKCGVYQSGEPAQPEEIEDARIALNLMCKEMTVDGIDIPWRRTLTLFLSAGTRSYSLGETGGHITESFFETTLTADAPAGSIVLALASTSGINSGDFAGVRLDDGTLHWSTINGSTLTSALPSAASSGKAVYTYTTKATRPLKIIHATRRQGLIDVPVDLIGDVAYQSLSLKSAAGFVNQVNYQATLPNGTLKVWPTGGEKLTLIAQDEMDTFIHLTDTPDCPREWFNMLVWKLASEIAPEYGVLSAKDLVTLERRAESKYQNVLDYDVENASVIVTLERR